MQTLPLLPTASYQCREYAYERTSESDLADGTLSLFVRRGKKVLATEYDLQCEREEDGILHRVYLCRRENGEVYGVEFTLSVPVLTFCSCTGFKRWGRCKHADSCFDLLKRGYLDPVIEHGDPDFQGGWTDLEIECYEEYLAAQEVEQRIHAALTVRALLGIAR